VLARCAYSLACQEANKQYSQAHDGGACRERADWHARAKFKARQTEG